MIIINNSKTRRLYARIHICFFSLSLLFQTKKKEEEEEAIERTIDICAAKFIPIIISYILRKFI